MDSGNMNNSSSKRSLTPEERRLYEQRSAARAEKLAKMTPEERKIYEQRLAAKREMLARMTPEEKAAYQKRVEAARRKKAAEVQKIKEQNKFEDVYSDSKKKAKKSSDKKNKKTKRIIIAVACILALLVAAGSFCAWYYVNNILGNVTIEDAEEKKDEDNNSFSKIYDETLTFEKMYDITSMNSYQDYVLEWSTNGGQILDSKNITNVLLIGEDGDATETSNGRSDCIMIVSIDRKNQKITISSVMRDSYCCYDDGNGNTNYGKINASCFYGGYKGLISTLENFYKIDIDYYVSVNFNSFPNLINALGGVTVPIQEYEARYIRNTTVHKTVQSGDAVKLDGWEALVFCRIRHCDSDSDVSRTRRQREVIEAIMQSAKGASKGQLLNAIKQVSPYIKTNMDKSTMIAFGTAALKNDWILFPINQYTYPVTYTQDGTVESTDITGINATIRGESCWAVDYPRSAFIMQSRIYGFSNIELSNERMSMEEIQRYASNYYY